MTRAHAALRRLIAHFRTSTPPVGTRILVRDEGYTGVVVDHEHLDPELPKPRASLLLRPGSARHFFILLDEEHRNEDFLFNPYYVIAAADANWEIVGEVAAAPPPIALKTLNSRPGAATCAACGASLREPYPGIKFCPACEQ